ncbi:RNA polymerase sigma factor FliA [Pseudomarimonas arenosa]|uniref:RNA polymerase sigma factor FliA n=1 Tax=Pseudomarimonas arenosa TaxID=2774145 RepID=A0AAW3ZHI9_9GAMM|nr:RNA polymerase sigma factor FliA [Pseudomarimonas arenosa]MBD8524724.1 RNA polymerase sigma factor FliA [Pseudomarimonas arenosa]
MSAPSLYRDASKASTSDLVTRHADLVRRIAHHVAARLPPNVEVEDLIQAGMVGLIEAARQFDRSAGASFETYASIRIRGAMIDEIRRGDWIPRSVHRRVREAAEATRQIEQREGRAANAGEVAQALGISLDDYGRLMEGAARGHVLSLDDDEDHRTESRSTEHAPAAHQAIEAAEFQQQLVDAIDKLPERERLILSLYYEQELNLREIGAVLGITESRVCQVHGQAMVRLRARLQDWREHVST